MGFEEIYTRKTNTAMILSAGHSMPVVLRHIKGAVSYGTLKIVDFEKIWHIKVTVIPQDLMLLSKSCFCIWFENLHFCWKKIWFTNSSALPNI